MEEKKQTVYRFNMPYSVMLLMTQATTVKYSLVVMLPLFVRVENDSFD